MRTDKKVIGIGHNSGQKQPKSAKERAKSHYQRKTEAGWKKTWVDPDTLALADELGGIEAVAANRAELAKKIEKQAAELDDLRSRGLWSRILNRKS